MPTTPVEIENRDHLPLRGDLHLPAGAGPHPLVLVVHGFKGFKDWGFFPWLAESLGRAGFAAFRFNFARSGIGDDPLVFDRLDLFEENSISREIADLVDLLAALPGHPDFTDADLDRIGVIGHSRGGGVAILFAAAEPRIRSVVTWAGVSSFPDFFPPERIEAWGRDGVLEVENRRTGQLMPLGRELHGDLTVRREALDVAAAERRLGRPHLILHGDADESVPIGAAHALHEASGGAARLAVLPGAGHTFGATHPLLDGTPDLDRALAETIAHFRDTLRA